MDHRGTVPTRKPPDNEEQLELFSAIFRDIAGRDTQETMEAPFLSLSKSPRFKPIHYRSGNVEILVSAGEPHGVANIFDWDLVIWLLSQIRHAKDQRKSVSRRIHFTRRAYLKDARRHASGNEYKRLESTIARLKHTTVTTTIRAERHRTVMFNWFESVQVERDTKGFVRDVTVELPQWLFKAVCDHRLVLTLHRDYFLLTGGIERWLYRLIRKGAGKTSWSWPLRKLHELSGTTRPYKYFASDLRKIVSRRTLLDYDLSLTARNGVPHLQACRRKSNNSPKFIQMTPNCDQTPKLKLDTYEAARQAAPGFDVYVLEAQWQRFNNENDSSLTDPDAAFIAFCKTHALRNPIATR